jgi:hypothetical protein
MGANAVARGLGHILSPATLPIVGGSHHGTGVEQPNRTEVFRGQAYAQIAVTTSVTVTPPTRSAHPALACQPEPSEVGAEASMNASAFSIPGVTRASAPPEMTLLPVGQLAVVVTGPGVPCWPWAELWTMTYPDTPGGPGGPVIEVGGVDVRVVAVVADEVGGVDVPVGAVVDADEVVVEAAALIGTCGRGPVDEEELTRAAVERPILTSNRVPTAVQSHHFP